MKLEYIVTNNDTNKNIKDILLSHFQISHRLLVTLKRENCIFLNDTPTFVHHKVNAGDIISVSFSYEEDNSNIVPKKLTLDIIYEDDCYIVINKPAGIPVHPSMSHYEDSLSNGIRYYFDSIGLKKKIRPVNRIDKDTSGLVVFAKNEYIQEALIKQMASKNFRKEYIAIVEGHFKQLSHKSPPRRLRMVYTFSSTKAQKKIYHAAVANLLHYKKFPKKGTIDKPITRKENSIIERCINDNGDKAITHYEVLKELIINNKEFSIVKCILETGRTHQIRVHMSYIGHPLLGDDLYAGDTSLITRQALHSYKICFTHPITQKLVSYEAPLPNDLNRILNM